MQAVISQFHDTAKCTWCKKEAEGVTIEFDGGFLQKGELCWKCAQQATRVHQMQNGGCKNESHPKDPGVN